MNTVIHDTTPSRLREVQAAAKDSNRTLYAWKTEAGAIVSCPHPAHVPMGHTWWIVPACGSPMPMGAL